MTKRNHKHTKTPFYKQKSLWIFVTIGGLLTLLGVFVFSNRVNVAAGTPEIVVDHQTLDLGYQPFEKRLTFSIKVTNAGNGTLRFSEQPYLEVLEGC
ncbi:MAG: hypothetical protein AB1457_07785 [Chloroflexota bacterium]|nr:MAG: hypothetical protein KatS3mg045_1463 [Bellilinea sp.]